MLREYWEIPPVRSGKRGGLYLKADRRKLIAGGFRVSTYCRIE
ncbi:hypothetical protein [Stratiformator vulcanicus]|nr:hypothetical protein [Stratiformator vulcanicus]